MIMEDKIITLKVYLKEKKSPLIAKLNSESKIEMFMDKLNNTEMYVRFGSLIFEKDQFSYALFY